MTETLRERLERHRRQHPTHREFSANDLDAAVATERERAARVAEASAAKVKKLMAKLANGSDAYVRADAVVSNALDIAAAIRKGEDDG